MGNCGTVEGKCWSEEDYVMGNDWELQGWWTTVLGVC